MVMLAQSLTVLLVLLVTASAPAANLLKNGSFEGSTKYWVPPGESALEEHGAAHGRFCLRLDKGYIRSGAFPLTLGSTVTVSLCARTATAGQVTVSLSPSCRPVGQQTGWVWNNKRKWRADTTAQWRRVSWKIAIPKIGDQGFLTRKPWYWNAKTWIVNIEGTKPLWIDAVTIAPGAGAEAYVPYSPLEVTATALDLPGYTTNGNLLAGEAAVRVQAAAVNATTTTRPCTLRWELLDYAGEQRFGEPQEEKVVLRPGESWLGEKVVRLSGRGLMLARVSAIDPAGQVIATSDQPLTALAFPKAATTPNPAERFGASLRDGPLVECAQQIGLGWTRWYPQLNWRSVQPNGPDEWVWPDATVDRLQAHGISVNAVLHPPAKWALGKDGFIPKDMDDWSAQDPRWDDLSVRTNWDRFVEAAARHYADKSVVWEFANEPDLRKGLDKALYARLLKRTHDVLKRANPKALVLINETHPGLHYHADLLGKGLGDWFDVFTFHNYTAGNLATPRSVSDTLRAFESAGLRDKQVWFNEGWLCYPTSEDYAGPPVLDLAPAEAAHLTVRNAAELFAAGMEKLITFHIGYAEHGKSFWDWEGAGTQWWDDHGNPNVACGVFNVLCEELGLSRWVKTIETDRAVLHVFHNDRRGRGVAVVWSLGGEVELTLPLTGVQRMDVMGNAGPLTIVGNRSRLTLPADRRPCYLFARGLSGEQLAEALTPLQKDLRVAVDGVYRMPQEWQGVAGQKADGNPFVASGKPLWRLDRVWPDDPSNPAHYTPMVWDPKRQQWYATEHAHGGQPAARVTEGNVLLAARAAWNGNPGQKLATLVFLAPEAGEYQAEGLAEADLWEGMGAAWIRALVLDRKAGAAREVAQVQVVQPGSERKRVRAPFAVGPVSLATGQELALVPKFGNSHHVAGNFVIRGLKVKRLGP